MNDLIPTINEIVKFGLEPNLEVPEKRLLLEKNLVKIYALSFDIAYTFDEKDYTEFDKVPFKENVGRNIISNFPDFGYYKVVIDISDLSNLAEAGIGDAVDDLHDIILDLLEIKWRIENNGWNDGLWYFELTFRGHTKDHILGLLHYLEETR